MRHSPILCGLLAVLSALPSLAATKTWTGAVNGSWSDSGNWSPGGAPAAGDDAVFNDSATTKSISFDLPVGADLNSLTFSGSGYSIVPAGAPGIILVGGITASNASGTSNSLFVTVRADANQTISVQNANAFLLMSGLGLNTAVTLTVAGAGTLNVTGVVNLAGSIVKNSTGLMTLSGNNLYSGTTAVNAGVLAISNANALGATSSGTTVASGATLRVSNGITLAAEPITISGGGTGGSGALAGAGAQPVTVSGPVTLGANATVTSDPGSTLTLSGVVSGAHALTAGTATANGIVHLTGSNTYTSSTVAGGSLLVDGSQGSSGVLVASGGTLGGGGTVGDVIVGAGGHVAPGASPGVLSVGSITFASGANYDVELNGTTIGNFDSTISTGANAQVSGANLNVSLGFVPSTGNAFDILVKVPAGAIVGTFAGLPQGGGLVVNGKELTISYTGGSGGNDVILTVVPTLAVSITPGSTSSCPPINVLLTANPTGGSGTYSSYQWYLNAAPIMSATNSTYTATQPGLYTVTVTDSAAITSTQSVATVLGDTTAPTVLSPAATTVTQTTCS